MNNIIETYVLEDGTSHTMIDVVETTYENKKLIRTALTVLDNRIEMVKGEIHIELEDVKRRIKRMEIVALLNTIALIILGIVK